jgi:hypothetical protein
MVDQKGDGTGDRQSWVGVGRPKMSRATRATRVEEASRDQRCGDVEGRRW